MHSLRTETLMLCVCACVRQISCAARATMDTVVCVGVSLVSHMRVTHVPQRTEVYAFRWAHQKTQTGLGCFAHARDSVLCMLCSQK